jgi:hypothetical protein
MGGAGSPHWSRVRTPASPTSGVGALEQPTLPASKAPKSGNAKSSKVLREGSIEMARELPEAR